MGVKARGRGPRPREPAGKPHEGLGASETGRAQPRSEWTWRHTLGFSRQEHWSGLPFPPQGGEQSAVGNHQELKDSSVCAGECEDLGDVAVE